MRRWIANVLHQLAWIIAPPPEKSIESQWSAVATIAGCEPWDKETADELYAAADTLDKLRERPSYER